MAGYQLSVSDAVLGAVACRCANIAGELRRCSRDIIVLNDFIFILGRKKKEIKSLR
jgi:hypothetical protein